MIYEYGEHTVCDDGDVKLKSIETKIFYESLHEMKTMEKLNNYCKKKPLIFFR